MKLQNDIKELFHRYLSGTCSEEDVLHLLDYFQAESDVTQLRELILAELENDEPFEITEKQETILHNVSVSLYERISYQRARVKRLYLTWASIASIVVCVSLWGGYKWIDSKSSVNNQNNTLSAILPGTDKAVLILEDGQEIALDSTSVVAGDNSLVYADSSGMMTLNSANLPKDVVNEIRTVRTPNGGQFAVVLDDGTKVWLNAASSITFPTKFTGNKRSVNVTGEAYFEVAKDPTKTFQVHARQQTINVLGTHFNLNAYSENRTVQTGLFEGRVMIAAGGNEIELRPGQLAKWSEVGKGLKVENISDMESLLAWKNGMFSFDNSSIVEIMQIISRWYDVEVAFENDDYSQCTFDGMISKKESIEQVLNILSASQQLAFKVTGKKIVVSLLRTNNN